MDTMTTVTLILLTLVVLPFIYFVGMVILEVIGDILYFIVRVIDKVTSRKTRKE